MSEMKIPVVVEGLVINPGDRVLIAVPKDVSTGQASMVKDRLEREFPGAFFFIIGGPSGMAKMPRILRPEDHDPVYDLDSKEHSS